MAGWGSALFLTSNQGNSPQPKLLHFRRDRAVGNDSVSDMTLWTPDGERRVSTAAEGSEQSGESGGPGGAAGLAGTASPELTPEQEEQARAMAHELAEARARLLETEVSTVLTNHALGIYELAAIHLTAEEPKMSEAQLAIDGLAALVEGLAGRLGEGESTLTDALHQARMAYVQRSSQLAEAPKAEESGTTDEG